MPEVKFAVTGNVSRWSIAVEDAHIKFHNPVKTATFDLNAGEHYALFFKIWGTPGQEYSVTAMRGEQRLLARSIEGVLDDSGNTYGVEGFTP